MFIFPTVFLGDGGGSGGDPDFDPTELKSGAYHDAQTNSRDTGTGKLLIVGAFGLGLKTAYYMRDYSQFIAYPDAGRTDVPGIGAGVQCSAATHSRAQLYVTRDDGVLHVRYSVSTVDEDPTTPWQKVYSENNPPIPAVWDSPGATVLAYLEIAPGADMIEAGQTLQGSALKAGSIVSLNGALNFGAMGTLPGSWRLQGFLPGGLDATLPAVTLVQRTDTAAAVAGLTPGRVRNLRYADEQGRAIDCELLVGDVWLPFTATAADSAAHGVEIFTKAAAGDYGAVAAFGGVA